jgi:hypothetical protein
MTPQKTVEEMCCVNNKRVSLAAFFAMRKEDVRSVDVSNCTGLTTLTAPNAESVDVSGCTGLTTLAAPNAEYVDARGCTALTALTAPNAAYVDARGCTALTALAAPNAEYVDVSGCTGLTTLTAPNAEYVDVSGCTALTGWDWIEAGSDARGYTFIGIKIRGSWRVIAGCRNLSPAEAIAHWSRPGAARGCIEIVRALVAAIERYPAKAGDQ